MNIVNVGYDSTNYYVIEQSGKRLLIDVGFPGTLPKLLAELKRKGLALADLSYLCVTHYHPDHAGLVQELKNKGLRHIVLKEQLDSVSLQKNYIKPDSGYVDIRLADSLQLSTADSRAWLLKNLGLAGEIVSTPGHSPDSVSLILDAGQAFTGDLTPAAMLTDGETELAQHSWDLLHRLNARAIYPGHGPTWPIF
jgi:glyoxylase-like metal-dependent hydrolase (beta-lactamase superfamily II)